MAWQRCGRASPALIKVVAAPGGQDKHLLRPAVFSEQGGGSADVASASSWKVLSWVEKERFGLVSEFSSDNFSR